MNIYARYIIRMLQIKSICSKILDIHDILTFRIIIQYFIKIVLSVFDILLLHLLIVLTNICTTYIQYNLQNIFMYTYIMYYMYVLYCKCLNSARVRLARVSARLGLVWLESRLGSFFFRK